MKKLLLFVLPFLIFGCSSSPDYKQQSKEAAKQAEQKLKDSYDCSKNEECATILVKIMNELETYEKDSSDENKKVLFSLFDDFAKIRYEMETNFVDNTTLSDEFKTDTQDGVKKEVNENIEHLKNYVNEGKISSAMFLIKYMTELSE